MSNDNPELDAIIEEASLTSEESPAEEPTEDKPEGQEETPTKEGETEEEKFADKPDLTGKTPEELEEIYQSWNKAYTQKRQAEKEELRKQREEFARAKEELERYKTQTPQKSLAEMNPQELAEHFAQKAKEIASVAKENSYIESQEQAFYGLDKRLDENNPEFDEALFYSTVGVLTKEREQFEKENGTVVGFDFVGKAKEKIKAYDEKVKQRVQSYLKKQGEIARTKTDRFGKTNPNTKSGKVKKSGSMDLDEAMNEAMAETGAKFSW
jgi:hypothetical protein